MPATAQRHDAVEAIRRPMPPEGRPPRPVENVTRVNVAFPFSTITVGSSDLTDTVTELAEIVAALATQLDDRRSTPETAETAIWARALVEGLHD